MDTKTRKHKKLKSNAFLIIPPSKRILWFILPLVGLLLGLTVLFAFISYSTRNIRFVVSEGGIEIKGCIYGRFISRDILVTEKARIVDLNNEKLLRPSARTNGTSLPGYNEGWFRLSNGQKALLFTTDKSAVIYVPTTEKYDLMISPVQPEKCLGVLKAKFGNDLSFPIVPGSTRSMVFILLVVCLPMLLVLAFFAYIVYSAKKISVNLSPQALQIKGAIYGRTINRENLLVENAKTVNMKTERDYKVSWRTNGIGLPGYSVGWFKLKNKDKALLFVTDRTRVVYIPTNQGYAVLLSVRQPDEFLQTLQS